MCRLSTFRRIVLGFIGVVSCLSIILSICLVPCITHKASVSVMVGIPGLALAAILGSTLRKALLKSPQSVAVEAAITFIFVPIEIILTLFVLALDVTLDKNTVQILFALEILIFVNDGILFLYSTGLLLTAMLTSFVFDNDVWSRDIDSSPSPFPSSLLLKFVLPCLRPPADPPSEPADAEPGYCQPGCTCTRKLSQEPETAEFSTARSLASRHSSIGSRSQSLIQLPDEFQRRSSIIVAFEV